jgi:1,4-dihydroxy-2-naphthoate octaprenyltransferase
VEVVTQALAGSRSKGESRWRIWLSALRPATLPAAAAPVAVGTALAAAQDRAHAPSALAALAVALFLQIGTNLHNDGADFARGADGPDRLGPPRAVAQGWLSARRVRRAAWVSFALATLAGLALVARAGWPLLLLGLASVASGYLYTGGRRPLAYLGLGDLFVLLFFGVVAVSGSYYAQAGSLEPAVLASSLAVGSLATAILVVNNLRDRAGDARARKATLVVRFGERFGRLEYATLVIFAYAMVLAVYAIERDAGWLLPLVSLPIAARQIARMRRLDGAALNPELGATARLGLIFSALLSLGVLL